MSPGCEHVVLVGLMGVGKSTVGARLADSLGWPLVDSDEQVESATGRTVREIFESDGEPAFRALEARALAEALDAPGPSIIAAAGGVVLAEENRRRLQAPKVEVVWLRADASHGHRACGRGCASSVARLMIRRGCSLGWPRSASRCIGRWPITSSTSTDARSRKSRPRCSRCLAHADRAGGAEGSPLRRAHRARSEPRARRPCFRLA